MTRPHPKRTMLQQAHRALAAALAVGLLLGAACSSDDPDTDDAAGTEAPDDQSRDATSEEVSDAEEITGELLEGLSGEDLPDGFPDVPLPADLRISGSQQSGSGNWEVYGLVFGGDPLEVLDGVRTQLESDGWTIGDLAGAARPDTEGFRATRGDQTYELATVGGSAGGQFQVVLRLLGFDT